AVREQLGVPVMLDESLCCMEDAERAITGQWCDLFNIRLSKCGGLIRSARLALKAIENGLSYQLGCQVGETGILSAAGRHFACTLTGYRFLEGSYDRFLVKDRLILEDITFRRGGRAPARSG
ncbi:MAG: enolase C-terminal domain-like protein, partial [Phycisphaerae bacterium]